MKIHARRLTPLELPKEMGTRFATFRGGIFELCAGMGTNMPDSIKKDFPLVFEAEKIAEAGKQRVRLIKLLI